MNEVGKMLLSILEITHPILIILFLYAVSRVWKIVTFRRWLKRCREESRINFEKREERMKEGKNG